MVNGTQNQRRCEFDTDDLDAIMDRLAAERLRAVAHQRSLMNADQWLIVEDEAGKTSSIKIH